VQAIAPSARGRQRLALATYDKAPGLAPDDQLLLPALAAEGIDAQSAVWSNPEVRWESFDAVVIRSCWNYHLHPIEFIRWLDRLESAGVSIFNSPTLVRWNADKRYLIDLAARGAATIPSRLVPAGQPAQAASILALERWPHAVIKPAMSASGYETYAIHFPLDARDEARVERVLALGDGLLQPFADEVQRNGEYSLIFLDGAFSHATIKRAGGSEFRVQTEHGGSVAAIDAPAAFVAQAARILGLLPETPLYARVDGIGRGDLFLLMELELIEPNLFFEFGRGAAGRFATALGARLGY
jgi:glutathione synthase/RimK-type ligase-like ATP-grasp enzyme